MIFIGALIFFYIYSINLTDIEEKTLQNLIRNAEIVSDNLVSPGIPLDWTTTDVLLIGITDEEKRLRVEKLEQFDNLALNNYSKSKKLLSTKNNYYVFFEDKNAKRVKINNIDYIGRDYDLDSPKNIIKVYRFIIYNSTILRMGVYVW